MKLKPCPFCGGQAVQRFTIWGETYAYGCYTIGCMGNVHQTCAGFKTDKEAIEAWNRREPMDEIITKLESRFMAEENRFRMGVYLDVIEMLKGASNEADRC